MASSTRQLYPEIEPFASGWLKVSDVHEIYYEQSGNKEGKPVVFMLVHFYFIIVYNQNFKQGMSLHTVD